MNGPSRTLGIGWLAAAPLWAAPQVLTQPPTQDPSTALTPQDQLLQQLFQPPPDPLNSIWNRPQQAPRRQFTGFPTFPTRLSGYGAYPMDPAAVPGTGPTLPLLPAMAIPFEPEEPATSWPAWVTSKQPLPYDPSTALLVQHVERVWWRAKPDEAFVPLFFHDKFALLTAGSTMEVRQSGACEVLLHETGRLVAHGPTRLQVQRLDADHVEVDVPTLTRLRIVTTGRSHTYALPDGSRLSIPAAPGAPAAAAEPAATETPAPGTEELPPPLPNVGDLVLERAIEPGWLSGRATITNLGERDVLWHRPSGTLTLRPGERGTFFLSKPPDGAAAADLVATNIELARDGRAMQGRATGGQAQVGWCGAAFELAPGTTLRMDPLQGDPFAPKAASGPTR